MNRRLKILVVGNYPPDGQPSMRKFAQLLVANYRPHADVTLIRPTAFFSRLPGISSAFIKKYLAYIDKLIIFPLWLAFIVRHNDRVHIADHSNAYYCFCCSKTRCIVTCHDLLAVRSALGEHSVAIDTSSFGIWLQRLIMAGLRRADAVAFVSHATYADFQRLIGIPPGQCHAVIPNPLNAPFSPDPGAFPLTTEEEAQIPDSPFLLMVGSALPRKNRGLALRLLQRLGPASPYRLVFAGAPLTDLEQAFRAADPLGSRLVSIPRPSHGLLNRLYCRAHALLFPSFSEGFGWPLVEAQTCRCPVIASPTTSIPEVAGDGAFYADPTDVSAFASHVRALEDPSERARLIALGSANTRRFDPEGVGEAYRRFAFQF